jgi:hypothetical protein
VANTSGLKIGIYSPFLHIYGGGEKFVGKIAEILSYNNKVEFIVTNDIDLCQLQSRLGLDLSRINLINLKLSRLKTRVPYLRRWVISQAVSVVSQNYDIFINQETLSFIPNRAKMGIVICQIA